MSEPRPELFHNVSNSAFDVVHKPLTVWTRLYEIGALRKALLLAVLGLIWEIYGRWLGDKNLLPTLIQTAKALLDSVQSAELPKAAFFTITLLLKGYVAGLLLAGLLTAFASITRVGADLLETLTAMFNPLPSIALLPLAMLWFGLSEGSLIFVLIHAVLWSVALNTHAGFSGVSPTLRMVGQSYGLSKVSFILRILVPGAFPSILTGLKVGWAFAWRTLIAAELVFGASSKSGGLGWFISVNKNELRISNVFAGLLTIMIFGLFVEYGIFRAIEKRTVQRWGMQL
jgi:NitT/TauT family transport system permease protein